MLNPNCWSAENVILGDVAIVLEVVGPLGSVNSLVRFLMIIYIQASNSLAPTGR